MTIAEADEADEACEATVSGMETIAWKMSSEAHAGASTGAPGGGGSAVGGGGDAIAGGDASRGCRPPCIGDRQRTDLGPEGPRS